MCSKKISPVLCILLASFSISAVAEMPLVSPLDAGYDADKLSEADSELKALYYDGLIPNYVVAAAKDGEIFYSSALGAMQIGTGANVDIYTRYQVASMTKPLVSVVVFKLIEEGKLALNDEISEYLPEFADMFVAPGGSLENLEEANRGITILDLITHTSGLTYGTAVTGQGDVAQLYDELGPYNTCNSADENMDVLSQIPLVAQPGTEWNYSVGIDVLGAIIQVVTGQTLFENIDKKILQPLGMDRSTFQYSQEVADSQVAAIAVSPLAGATALGRVDGSDIDWKISHDGNPFLSCGPTSPDFKFESGGGGMTMSVHDYLVFLSMIANGGTLNGVQILDSSSVDMMQKEQVQNLNYPAMIGNNVFGAGFGIALDEDDASVVDYYTWGGIFNTGFWINPSDKSVGVIATSVYPGRYNQTISLEEKFDEARFSD